MALKAVVDNLDTVDENLKGHYVPEKDKDQKETGRFVLTVDSQEGYEVVNTSGFRKTLDTLRSEVKEHKRTLAGFEGIDPEVYKTMSDELQRLKEADPEKEDHINEEVAKRTEAVQTKMQQQLETFKAEATKQQEAIAGDRDKFRKMLLDVSVTEKALTLASKISPSPELLAPHIEPFLKLNTDGDKPVLEVVDANGTPRSGKDFSTPMSTDELLEEISGEQKFAPLIKAPSKSGPGNEPPSKLNFGPTPPKFETSGSMKSKVAAIEARVAAEG